MDTEYLRIRKYQMSLHWAAILLVVLIFCLYGLYLPVGPINIRPEKLLALAAMPIMFGWLCLKGKLFTVNRLHLLLSAWIILALLVSLFSVDPKPMVKHWVDLILSIFFFYLIFTCRPVEILRFRPNHVLGIGLLLGFCGSMVTVLYWQGFSVDGNFLSNFAYTEKSALRVKMTLWESNIYGAVMAVFCLLSVAEMRKKSVTDWLIFFFCHAGLVLSYSRGPLVAYFLGLIVYFRLIGMKNAGRVLAALLLVAATFTTYKLTRIGLGYEVESAFMRYDTLLTRLVVLDYAFDTIRGHPLLGSGIYSAESLYPEVGHKLGAEEGAKGWIGILPVAIVHDTGIVGFALFYGFFYLIFRNGYRAILRCRELGADPAVVRRMAAWVGSGILLHVVSLASSLYSMAIFWSVMAVIAFLPSVARAYAAADTLDHK